MRRHQQEQLDATKREQEWQATIKKRKEIFEQKARALRPSLEEIKNFANTTGAYPLDRDRWEKPQLIQPAEVTDFFDTKDKNSFLRMSYGVKGVISESFPSSDPDSHSMETVFSDSVDYIGISLQIDTDSGTTSLLSKKEITIPPQKEIPGGWVGGGRSSYYKPGVPARPEHTKIMTEWIPLSEDPQLLKKQLADAFHDSVFLGSERLFDFEYNRRKKTQAESPASVGQGFIASLKRLLGQD